MANPEGCNQYKKCASGGRGPGSIGDKQRFKNPAQHAGAVSRKTSNKSIYHLSFDAAANRTRRGVRMWKRAEMYKGHKLSAFK